MILYLIRHGQTDWNAIKRLQGQTDTEMTAKGREQARRNGRVLAELLDDPARFEFVSSPLKRARMTMEIIRGELGLGASDFQLDDRLKEIDYGAWAGFSWEELRLKEPVAVNKRFADPWHQAAPGGESYCALSARALAWFEERTADTIATAHGGILRVLRGAIEGIDPAKIPFLEVPQHKIMVIKDGTVSWL